MREPDFCGFFFGEALGDATRSIDATTVNVSDVDTRAYGVAILWLVYEKMGSISHLGLFINADGTLTFAGPT